LNEANATAKVLKVFNLPKKSPLFSQITQDLLWFCGFFRIFAVDRTIIWFMSHIVEKRKEFNEWQQRPFQVAKKSEERHCCTTCGEEYQGNYCPRCGQSAQIGRYSFKKAFLLFLDVWGVGNRGMFRSIRDLLLRPGYMIRDYLRGMQMAYFPPFKMLFLLCTLSILVNSGMNIKGVNRFKQQEEKFSITVQLDNPEEKTDKTLTKAEEKRQQRKKEFINKLDSGEIFMKSFQWINKNISLVYLACLLLFSVPLYLMFRHSPAIPDLRFSECFVAMVYITNMLLIYGIFFSLLWPNDTADNVFDLLVIPLVIIPVKQFSGYSYWGTIWRTIVAFIPFAAMLILLTVAILFIYGLIYIHY
jgi:Protein of unknown function (DUF3667).